MSIQAEHLTYIYNKGMAYETAALSDVSFTIQTGEFTGIIGHTGSGKSTLIQQLNGILKPDSGRILIDGVDITAKDVKLSEIRKQVGLVFQYPEYQLFEETVSLDVAFGPLNLGLEKEEAQKRVREAMELVGLSYERLKDRSPFELSGGQKRRAAIAGVIAMKPKVLILDEPTAGLDPKAHDDIIRMLEEIHRHEKNNIILVSHNMSDVAEAADRIIVMDRGRIAAMGTPQEVYQNGKLIEAIGLELPDTMQLALQLEKRGIHLHGPMLTMDQAVSRIETLLKGNE